MKVIIGSVNKDKIKIVKDAFKSLNLDVDVESVESDSEIAKKPLDKLTAMKVAINCAKNANAKEVRADFWIGLEEGLRVHNEDNYLVTVACLIDKDGGQYVSEGAEISLSAEEFKGVKTGEWFGDVVRICTKNKETTENFKTRLAPFTRAVQSAYVEYLKQTSDMKFRQRISAVVMDLNEIFLIVQLTKYGQNDWNFAGGGINEGEKPEVAVLRELSEELGTNKFEIVKKSGHKEVYDWPNWLIADDICNNKPIYRGQEATFFLVKFLGDKSDIKIDLNELRKVKWVNYEEIKNNFNFPRQIGLTDKLRDLFNA